MKLKKLNIKNKKAMIISVGGLAITGLVVISHFMWGRKNFKDGYRVGSIKGSIDTADEKDDEIAELEYKIQTLIKENSLLHLRFDEISTKYFLLKNAEDKKTE